MYITTRYTFGSLIIHSYVSGAFIALANRKDPDHLYTFSQPVIEIDGKPRTNFIFSYVLGQRTHPRGWEDFELGFISAGEPEINLRVTFRRYFGSPFIRVRFRYTAPVPCTLTKIQRPGQPDLLWVWNSAPTRRAA